MVLRTSVCFVWYLVASTLFKPAAHLVSWNHYCVDVSMHVCVCLLPGYKKPFTWNKAWIANQTSPTAFQFTCMALAIDITDEHGLSNKTHHWLLSKKNVNLSVYSYLHMYVYTFCYILLVICIVDNYYRMVTQLCTMQQVEERLKHVIYWLALELNCKKLTM